MMQRTEAPELIFPRPDPPEFGVPEEISPGILWLRLPLPFELDSINLYLLEDDDGWALVDTGFADRRTRALWETLLSGPLRGRRLSRMIVTHYHPDHVGMAGWLSRHADLPLAMSRIEYAAAAELRADPGGFDTPEHRRFYVSHGLDAAMAGIVAGRGHTYLAGTTGLPDRYTVLTAGERLRIGGRDFDVRTGGGHAPDQVMLVAPTERVFIAADQVLARISPNVSVTAAAPEDDALGAYIASLTRLQAELPEDLLVLPGHERPFLGVHARIRALCAHHARRCGRIAEACAAVPLSAAELVPLLFARPLDPHQTGFAFSEVLAHINYMLGRGELRRETGPDGVHRVRAF